jgi:hypothetical protein
MAKQFHVIFYTHGSTVTSEMAWYALAGVMKVTKPSPGSKGVLVEPTRKT